MWRWSLKVRNNDSYRVKSTKITVLRLDQGMKVLRCLDGGTSCRALAVEPANALPSVARRRTRMARCHNQTATPIPNCSALCHGQRTSPWMRPPVRLTWPVTTGRMPLMPRRRGRWTRTKVRTNLHGQATGHLHKGGDGTRQ